MPLHRRILLSSPSDGTDLPSSSRQIHINVIIVAASAAAASLFLALIYYSILRRRRRTSIPSIHPASDVDATLAARDNPFWHVKTVGLDDSAIEALGSYAYRPAGGADVVCSVCLAEILDGETVRLLPRCGHVFHLLCVDTWLRCHVSCPLCRAAVGVAAPTVEDVEVAIAVDPQLEEGDEGEGEIGVRVRVSLEIRESSGGGVRSNSLDSAAMGGFLVGVEEEKEGDCTNSCKEEGSEKGRSESGRNLWFPRLGRAKSSSILRL